MPSPTALPASTAPSSGPSASGLESARMTGYHALLLLMLASATFFDGFDISILLAAAPILQSEHGLSHSSWGLVNTVIRLGAVCSFFLLLHADRYGRRLVITLTVIGYTAFTGLTGLSVGIVTFVVCQFFARVFLASEVGLAFVIVGEELPTRWRAVGIALLFGVSSLGGIVAFLTGRHVLPEYGWRTMYFLGVAPLVLVLILRLGMRETHRFQHRAQTTAPADWVESIKTGLWVPLQARYRGRSLLVAMIFNCVYLLAAPALVFWTIHAARFLDYSPKQYGLVVGVGFLAGLAVGAPLTGLLMNWIGRKATCVGFFILASLAVSVQFRVLDPDLRVQIGLMIGSMICYVGAMTVSSTYATELFPTEIRATCYGWTSNLFGRAAEILGPLLVGLLADRLGFPWAVTLVALGPLAGAAVVLKYAPETLGKTLEEISDSR